MNANLILIWTQIKLTYFWLYVRVCVIHVWFLINFPYANSIT